MISQQDVIEQAIEVFPIGEDGFRKVKETLTRIGVSNRTDKILTQSTHILHKQGHFYIMHFKEMFALDGLRTDISESDISRRNRIIQMLVDWKLIEPVDSEKLQPMANPGNIKIIKHSERDDWELRSKYAMGVMKHD